MWVKRAAPGIGVWVITLVGPSLVDQLFYFQLPLAVNLVGFAVGFALLVFGYWEYIQEFAYKYPFVLIPSGRIQRQRGWLKYHPTIEMRSREQNEQRIFIQYRLENGRIATCRIHVTIRLESRFPFGYTIFNAGRTRLIVMQKRGDGRVAYEFQPVPLLVQEAMQVHIKPGEHRDYDLAFVSSEGQDSLFGPKLDNEFDWCLQGMTVSLIGPQNFGGKLRAFKGHYRGWAYS